MAAFVTVFLLIYFLLFESKPPPTFDEVEIKFEEPPETDFSARQIEVPDFGTGQDGKRNGLLAQNEAEGQDRYSEAAIVREKPELSVALEPEPEEAAQSGGTSHFVRKADAQQGVAVADTVGHVPAASDGPAAQDGLSAEGTLFRQDGSQAGSSQPELNEEERRSASVLGIFVIQVASLSSEKGAHQLARELAQALKQSASVKQAEVDGKVMHRVWIGPFDDLVEVKFVMRLLKEIDAETYDESFVRAIL